MSKAYRKRADYTPVIVITVLLVAGGIGLAIVVALLWIKEPPTTQPPVEVDLASLLRDWKSNPVAVADKYKGKTVRVTGFVTGFNSYSITISAKPRGDRDVFDHEAIVELSS